MPGADSLLAIPSGVGGGAQREAGGGGLQGPWVSQAAGGLAPLPVSLSLGTLGVLRESEPCSVAFCWAWGTSRRPLRGQG